MIQTKIFVQFLKGCEEFLSGCFSFEEKVQVTKSVLSAIVSAQRTAIVLMTKANQGKIVIILLLKCFVSRL
jgi:hypothetical protein